VTLEAKPFLLSAQLLRETVPSFADYPFSLPAIRDLDRIEFHPKATFIIGENGAGKSTLIEAVAIACGFNPEGGSRNFRFSTRESHSVLHKHIRIARSFRRPRTGYFLRAESFFNVGTEIERLDPSLLDDAYGGRSLHEQSHGEAFMALLMHRFSRDGLYILDEPEAALSPTRQLAMLKRIHDLIAEGSQIVIATHSPILMAYPDATILAIERGLARVDFTETEHYRVMRSFLNNHEKVIRDLLAE